MQEEKSRDFEGKKEEEWLLMPLVTYTEGMPEFLEHQDTLCIRRRGTERYVKQAPKNARLTSRFAPKLADGKCVKKKCLTMLKLDFVTILV